MVGTMHQTSLLLAQLCIPHQRHPMPPVNLLRLLSMADERQPLLNRPRLIGRLLHLFLKLSSPLFKLILPMKLQSIQTHSLL